MVDGTSFEQVAVVADQQDRARVIPQVVFEPDVASRSRWLVGSSSSSRSRFGEEDAGESDAHAPAAGEIAAWPCLRLRVESEAGQDLGRPRRGGMGVYVGQPRVNLGDAVGVVGGLRLGEQLRAFDIGGQHGVDQAHVAARRFLGDNAQARFRGPRDGAAVGRHLTSYQAEQGRFTRAVTTDQRNAMALGNGDGGVVEDHTPAEAESQFIDVQHAEAGDSTVKVPF